MDEPQFPCQHGVPFGGAIPNCAKCTNASLNQGRPIFDRMAAMLRELEWAGGGESISLCPICGKRPEYTRYVPGEEVPGQPGFVYHTAQRVTVPGGHTPDCALAALLAELP